MSSQGSNQFTNFSKFNQLSPIHILVFDDCIEIHDFPSFLTRKSSKLFSNNHPIQVWTQNTACTLSRLIDLTDDAYDLLDNPQVVNRVGILGKIYKSVLIKGINSLSTWDDWARILNRCRDIILMGSSGGIDVIKGEILFHLLFVDEDLVEVMEKVDLYNRKYGPIIETMKMEIQRGAKLPRTAV